MPSRLANVRFDAAGLVARVLVQHPEPPGFKTRAARDVHDRQAAQYVIRAALNRRQR